MNIYDFQVTTIDGQSHSLAEKRGQVLLIVNVASQCGFTPQYAGLEALFRRYKDQGFAVLGFPCNQFGHQEPGDDGEIKRFCSTKYDVSFPLFAKINVAGPEAHPLYQFLTAEKKGLLGSRAIKWNFTKFLIDRDGAAVHRYAPTTTPDAIAKDIEALLRQPFRPPR